MTSLRSALGDAAYIFVVGKGGTGKSTAAAALALQLADHDTDVHLISTDPAHSLGDVLQEELRQGRSHCSDRLIVEEFDAAARAAEWLQRATVPVSEIINAGTYLDAEDVQGFTRLALPGLDEMMAVLRLVELADAGRRVVVDTAPTGHTLRLLDAAATHATLAHALRAMADKAAAVASSFAGRDVRLAGESFIAELERYATSYRTRVLDRAAFVLAARTDDMVTAETARLAEALRERRLTVAAHVWVGGIPQDLADTTSHFTVPWLHRVTGCDGLRAWSGAVGPAAAGNSPTRSGGDALSAQRAAQPGDAAAWLESQPWRLVVFAGKGGVGKTTCAAATALHLAASRDVLLCSTDPAGSLDDVFAADVTGPGRAADRLRTQQIDAEAQLQRIREQFRIEVLEALERIGLSESAALDRRVVESLWDLAPPGIDEFAALAALLDAGERTETVVLDTAPTGHFLRLLTLPDVALDWTRQLMRIVVKYHASGAGGGVAESLLQTARELRGLRDLLHDGTACGILVVTLEHPVVHAETQRLRRALDEAGMPAAALIVNRADDDFAAAAGNGITVRAPDLASPPTGSAALREFIRSWKIVG
jgi:arsenite/tail-anchored protein-transporting ATPase